MKTYRDIERIIMASNEIEYITFWPISALYDDDVIETKDEVIWRAGQVILTGYGTHSGRKVWQLPRHIKMQIKTFLSKNTLS